MKSSTLLQLDDDDTMVKRVAPLPEARNVDAETIYVENLPQNTDHDCLRKIFSQFGKVMYVSIPRFKHTGDIKGFAFIEFESSNEAGSAVETFHKETEEKENGQQGDQKPKRRKRPHSESDVDCRKQSSKTDTRTDRKRRRTTSESSADSQEGNLDSPKKKQHLALPECQPKIEEASSEEEGKVRKRKKNDKSVHWKHEDDESQSDVKVTEQKIKTEVKSEENSSKKQKSSECDSNAENVESEDERTKKKKETKTQSKREKGSKVTAFSRHSKERIITHAPVAYIDVKEGDAEGYLRFHTVDNCSTVFDNISADSSAGLELDKVTGEREREYWRKINADRMARFQAKREKKRGTEKVKFPLDLAESLRGCRNASPSIFVARKVAAAQVHQQVTHIRFDDE
ncbi:hypothetical protein QZH41_008439 [Actinostola sp. cb2023]|nr:hypothetical protein QZH41_008439 [Actinostola sp. cb2023]